MTSRTLAAIWIMSTLGIGAYLGVAINRDDKSVFLPGEMTSGHHQIGVACAQCHTPFGGVSQQACLDCHQDELHAAEDSHPERKFTDPRNADRAAKLDARKCVTCHTEHRPEITNVMAVTLPQDFCYQCHADIAEERPTHQGLTFDSCSSAGCHNFHDNRALYEDFLVRRGLEEPDVIVDGASPARHAFVSWEGSKLRPLTSADVARLAHYDEHAAASWAASPHASSGIACVDCHESSGVWSESPGYASCGRCHELESEGFLAGKHGMRLSVGLPAMPPAQARLPMQPDSLVKTLSCSSCHDAHAVNVRRAAVDSCLSCHADDHSKAYRDSPHFRLWQSEDSGEGKPGSGVSCASCHMPREERTLPGGEHIVVQHNQNANLRPNEKMIREVCLHCHGLEFSIDALSDRELIRQNFSGRPSRHIESIDMAVSRTR